MDIDKILANPPTRRHGGPRPRHPEVAAARHREQHIRSAAAQNIAKQALTYLHKDEYDELYKQARIKVNAERGPLPGDED